MMTTGEIRLWAAVLIVHRALWTRRRHANATSTMTKDDRHTLQASLVQGDIVKNVFVNVVRSAVSSAATAQGTRGS